MVSKFSISNMREGTSIKAIVLSYARLAGEICQYIVGTGYYLQSEKVPLQAKSGLFVGTNIGHFVTRRKLAPRPSANKGKRSKRIDFVRKLIWEVTGFAPYEKRITELLKVGKDKRALKVPKKKLGTHKRAKKKCEEMSNEARMNDDFSQLEEL
ncbi:hypothetical protein SUGI_1126290 [Cryptomeria japonica]|nr:hypothetical protein SUGI_1126290 [Cryptomeria japonica]